MTDEDNGGGGGLSSVRGLIGLIAANVSLIVAVMIYMGWAYESAFFGYFHLSPLDIGLSVQDYLLVSLNLFQPTVVVAAVVLVVAAVAVTRSADLGKVLKAVTEKAAASVRTDPRLRWLDEQIPHGRLKAWSEIKQKWWKPRAIQLTLGAIVTAAALLLYAIADRVRVSTYLVLALLALGPVLLTWGLRRTRGGRLPYSLAVAVFIVCGLWAGSLHADSMGKREAQAFVLSLPQKTEVAVYSVQRLALPGIGVRVSNLPAGYEYHYRYEGLRLLYMDSGTYYLLPVDWTPQVPLTYILDASDQMRVEFY